MKTDDARSAEYSRQLSAMQWRVEGLRRHEHAAPEQRVIMTAEALEALDTTMEELRVAVEDLQQKNDELRKVRAQLEAERQRYRELFDFAPDGYLVTDLHGVIRNANQSAAALLNVDRAYLVGKPLAVFIPEEGRSAFRSEMFRLKDTITSADYELRLQPRKGSPFEAAMRVAVARDARGNPIALRWTIRDVSAQKRAEEQIRALNTELEGRVTERSEQLEAEFQINERWLIKAYAASTEADASGNLFHELVQEADAIFWTIDAATGRYTFVSRRAEALLGYPHERWLVDPDFWTQRLHPDDREWAIAHRRRHLREGRDHEAEYRLVAADGREVWFRESVRVLTNERGQVSEIRGLMINITKRKKIERQLYTAKSQLAARLDDMTHLYELGLRLSGGLDLGPMLEEVLNAVISLQGTDLGAVFLYDHERDELSIAASAGLSDSLVARLGRMRRGEGAGGMALATGACVVVENVEKDPCFATLLDPVREAGIRAVFSHPLLSRQGEFVGTISTYFREPHRPSDRQVRMVEMYARQAADFLESAQLRSQAKESDRRKGEFLALMAHELRAPLSAILNAAHLLSTPEADEAALTYARKVVERQTRQMTHLVDDLLDATRLRNGTLQLRTEPLALDGIIARAVETARPAIETRNHDLRLIVPPEPMYVLADPVRIEQVLVNLLTNAAKYTERGGFITLLAQREGDQVVLRVRDNGVGIPPDLLPRVFDLFMQADGSSDNAARGLGIGLWIVRGLVEGHGGTVEALSDGPGRGSEFVVRLPITEAPPSTDQDSSPPSPAVASSQHILILDDNVESTQVLARLLQGWGHNVHVTHDGPSAIDAALRLHPDIVLLDLHLPGMDGFEVVRRLRQSADLAGARFVALTGASRETDPRATQGIGFDDIWTKPVDPDALRVLLQGKPASSAS
jgi:PAS domain S-box-containing protein